MMHARPCRRLAAVCLAVAVAVPVAGATPALANEALWRGEFATAADQLADARDPVTLRQLLLAQLALGRDLAAAATLQRYRGVMAGDPVDAAIIDLAAHTISLQSREHHRDLARTYAALAGARDLDAVDRRRYLDQQQRFELLAGNTSAVRKLAQELNRISDWGVLGPFDNTSGSGHGKEFLKFVAFNPRTTYEGKFGQPIAWFRPRLLPLDGSIAPHRHFYQDINTTSYVRTSVKVPATGQYLLSVGFAGDLEVRINGEVIIDADQETAGRERLHWLVTLAAGWNQLAFKISQREQGDVLAVGLGNADGTTIRGLEVAADKNLMAQNTPAAATPQRSPRDERLAARAAAQPDDPELALWDLQRARRELPPHDLLEYCDALAARFADVPLLRLQVALARHQAGSIARFEQAMADLAESAPELAIPHLYLATEDLRKQHRARALTRTQTVLSRAPDCLAAHRLKFDIYYHDQHWQDLRNGAWSAQQQFPNEAAPYYALMAWAEQVGDLKLLARHREEASKRVSPDARSVQLLFAHWQKEDFGRVRTYTKQLTDLMPDNIEAWRIHVRALLADNRAREAAVEIPRLMDSFPDDVTLIAMQAATVEMGVAFDRAAFMRGRTELFEALRRNEHLRNDEAVNRETKKIVAEYRSQVTAAAAEILTTALPADPANFTLRDRIRTMQGLKPYREVFPGITPAEITAKRVDASLYPGDSAIVIYAHRRHFFFDGQASLHDQTLAVQIRDQSGVEAWERYAPAAAARRDLTFLEYEILKPDGGREKAEVYDGQVLFKGLAVGDVVHLRYQLPAIVTGKLIGNIWDQHLFAFNALPCRESVFELVTPPGLDVTVKTWNDQPDPERRQAMPVRQKIDGGFDLWRWRYHDLPPVREEPGAADPRHYLPWVDVSTVADWSQIADWYHDLASGQAQPDTEIRLKAAEICEGALDDDDKVARIFRFVANSVTYKSLPFYQSNLIPRRAGEVLRDGFGDCKDMSCLMIALGRAAGVEDLRFALCTPNAPASPGFLPSPRFHHAVVARVRSTQRRDWYDPTLRHAEPGQVPRYLGGVPALVVDRLAGDLVVIDPSPATLYPSRIATRVELDGRGNASVDRQTAVQQVDRLAALRQQLAEVGDEELQTRLNRSLAVVYPGVKIRAGTATGLVPGDGEVVLSSRFDVPELASLGDGFLSINLPWQTELHEWAGLVVADERRRSPIDLRSLNLCEQEELHLVLPAGHRLAVLPENRAYEAHGCVYTTTFERTPGGLRAVRTLTLSGDLVTPERYDAFKTFLDSVRRDLQRSLHLRLG